MARNGFLSIAAATGMLVSTIGAPALARDGAANNRVALGAAGHATPSMRICAKVADAQMKARCAMGADANRLQDDQDDTDRSTGPGAGTFFIGALALGAIAAGIVAGVSGDDEPGNGPTLPTPPSPPPPVSS